MTDPAQDDPVQPADQILCEHRWVREAPDTQDARCAGCGLDYRDYVEGTVRAALSRMGGW